jgi:hypothetical protein
MTFHSAYVSSLAPGSTIRSSADWKYHHERRLQNPSSRLRAAAEVIHRAGVHHQWAGPSYKKTYAELEQTDPIGFEEFNEIVAAALEAADCSAS